MLIDPAPDFDDPIGLLKACHRRVERFLGILDGVCDRLPELAEDEKDALDAALRYFAEAAPLHIEDEELSLAPRLFALDDPEVQALRLEWARLEAEHKAKVPLLAALSSLGERLLAGEQTDPGLIAAFRRCVGSLVAIYGPHIAYEDNVLLPLARKVLDEEDLAEIGREIASRRRVER